MAAIKIEVIMCGKVGNEALPTPSASAMSGKSVSSEIKWGRGVLIAAIAVTVAAIILACGVFGRGTPYLIAGAFFVVVIPLFCYAAVKLWTQKVEAHSAPPMNVLS